MFVLLRVSYRTEKHNIPCFIQQNLTQHFSPLSKFSLFACLLLGLSSYGLLPVASKMSTEMSSNTGLFLRFHTLSTKQKPKSKSIRFPCKSQLIVAHLQCPCKVDQKFKELLRHIGAAARKWQSQVRMHAFLILSPCSMASLSQGRQGDGFID